MIDLNPAYTQNQLAELLSADLAVNNSSIYNLLNTTPGEQSRIFRTEVGSHWRNMLQENINDVTAAKIEIIILDSIEKWIPKIQLVRSLSYVEADFKLPGYRVRIEYIAPDNPLPKQVTFAIPA
jgi:phage baseplate assembly protein W